MSTQNLKRISYFRSQVFPLVDCLQDCSHSRLSKTSVKGIIPFLAELGITQSAFVRPALKPSAVLAALYPEENT